MDLILNPTSKCNFNCTFCAASNISKNNKDLSIRDTINFIEPYKSKLGMIVVNGGDPLMVDPKYYYELIKYLDTINRFIPISLTTNLWDFYNHPDKWVDLFKKKRIGIITSFQYGNDRRISEDRIYTPELFKKVINKFKKLVGYTPSFISVISDSNEDKIMDTVKLAKKFKTKCKINKVVIAGRNKTYYPRYKIYRHYLEIINKGYLETEMNCIQLKNFFNNRHTYCPLDRECYNNIRCINPNGVITSCSGIMDNHYTSEIKYDITSKDPLSYIKFHREFNYVKPECLSCKNFTLCNSCSIFVKEVIDNDDVDNYCTNMSEVIELLRKKLVE